MGEVNLKTDVQDHSWNEFTEEEIDYACERMFWMMRGLMITQGRRQIRDRIDIMKSRSVSLLSNDEISITFNYTWIGNDFLCFVGEMREKGGDVHAHSED